MNFFSSTPLSSFWIALIVAAFGGCLVLLGLWLEKGKEKSWFSNISDLRQQGSKAKWGWWILMAGIAFEVGDAIWTGYEIGQINPRNQPIFSATAFVRIKVLGTNQPNAIIPGGVPTRAMLTVSKDGEPYFVSQLSLTSDRFVEAMILFSGEDAREYVMRFDLDSAWAAFTKQRMIASKIERLGIATIWLSYLPIESEILGGSVKLIVNGIEKDFTILQQRAFEPLSISNTPAYKDDFRIIATSGTNGLPFNRGPQFSN